MDNEDENESRVPPRGAHIEVLSCCALPPFGQRITKRIWRNRAVCRHPRAGVGAMYIFASCIRRLSEQEHFNVATIRSAGASEPMEKPCLCRM